MSGSGVVVSSCWVQLLAFVVCVKLGSYSTVEVRVRGQLECIQTQTDLHTIHVPTHTQYMYMRMSLYACVHPVDVSCVHPSSRLCLAHI